ncbi:hypothetical protein [Pontibacter ruber]|uniref:Uncharacterized protein n=1 Tax=Pontibacter ruber TaxID=1343895 RepID=A0ABW5D0G6_9BACT|nr:hypothetical protein [Pontibacter ruber]
MYSGKKLKWFTIVGAMLWIVAGLLLSLRPAGHPPDSFRKSGDLIPVLAVGLVLIGVSTSLKMLAFRKAGGWLFKTVCQAVVLSSLSYALGVLIRHVFLQATGWEPFMPLGFLAFIISWALLGVISLKKGFLSRAAGLLMIASTISLLTFNDQYNPYGGVVFGVLTLFMILLPEHSQKQSPGSNLA